ncbi:MAG: ABC transporter permease [Cyclobacteriaceae bacterium]|nr:ABC transporter permease [Cyclobacteriaceae bacterium]
MNLSLFIARRYFLSRRKKNFINVISGLSMLGVAFATAALIIVLSVFNGLEVLLRSLYTSFDPELKIEAAQGKTFTVTDEWLEEVGQIPGVKTVTEVIEDYAYVRYRDAAMVVTVKGVSENFIDQRRLDKHLVEGELVLSRDSIPFAIMGRGVRYTLSAEVEDDTRALRMYYINDSRPGALSSASLYTQKSIRPGGVFSIEKNYDENYIFVPLPFAQELFRSGNQRTSVEVQTEGLQTAEVKEALQKHLGSGYQILTNEEQHKDLYRLLRIEKLFTFLSLSLLLLIASINIFFSLMMLSIDKKKDISILASLGATQALIRNIFLAEGALISFIGAVAGLILGGVLCYLQDTIGLVGMGMENAIVANYPVDIRPLDFLLTIVVIIVVSALVSFRPAVLASRAYSLSEL